MTIATWPSELSCGVADFELVGGGRSGGPGAGGLPAAIAGAPGGPHWVAKVSQLPLFTEAEIAAARALEGRLDGGARPVMINVCIGGLSPQIPGGSAMSAALTAGALAGATSLQLALTGSHYPLVGGEMLNVEDDEVDRRLHVITEVTGGTVNAPIVTIDPPLRAALSNAAPVHFTNLSCPMRLAEGLDLAVSLQRFSAIEATFEEWFEPAIVLALRTLVLSPHSVQTASPADTFVGYLLGTTAGSTVTLTDTAGGRFKVVEVSTDLWGIYTDGVATDYAAHHSHNITAREALAGYTNTPHDSVLTVNVTAAGHIAWRVFLPANNGASPAFTSLAKLIFAATEDGPDLTGSGTPISGGLGSEPVPNPPSQAFDGSDVTTWARSSPTDTWLGYLFAAPVAVVQARLQGSANHLQSPASAILQWSNDSTGDPESWTWVTFATATYGDTWVVSGTRACPETNPAGQYRKILMRNTASAGGGFEAIAELEIRNGGGSDLTPNGSDTTAGRPIGYSNLLNPPGAAFDNNAGSYWFAPAPGAGDVGFVFPDPVLAADLAVKPYSNANWAPGAFTVIGTNDDVTLDTLTTQAGLVPAGWTPGVFRTFSL